MRWRPAEFSDTTKKKVVCLEGSAVFWPQGIV